MISALSSVRWVELLGLIWLTELMKEFDDKVCLVSLTWLAWWRNRATGFFMHFQMLILRPTGTWA